jgi:hypothetical protein
MERLGLFSRGADREEGLAEFDRFAVLGQDFNDNAPVSALISFMTFMASMMQTTVSSWTSWPG